MTAYWQYQCSFSCPDIGINSYFVFNSISDFLIWFAVGMVAIFLTLLALGKVTLFEQVAEEHPITNKSETTRKS